MILAYILPSSFLKVKNKAGLIFHFAPAILLNLVETAAFQHVAISSDAVREAAATCPHPYMSQLCSNFEKAKGKGGLLEHLYCVVRCTPLPQFGGTSSDGSAFLLPLSQSCSMELLRSYLWSSPSCDDRPVEHTRPMNGFDLLPDHSRVRRSFAQAGDNILRHTYALLTDERFGMAEGPDDDPGSPQCGSSGRGQSCCYLVQLWSETAALAERSTKVSSEVHSAVNEAVISHSHLQDDQLLRAMLIAFGQGLGQTAEQSISGVAGNSGSSSVGRKKWDSTILSTVCRWRACLCEATENPPPKYLCRYHSELKIFLDGRLSASTSTSAAESAKYLPQKPPSIPVHIENKDLALIRAASTLLQEMWDGKLKATVRTFAKRVCSDMTLVRRTLALTGQKGKSGAKKISSSSSRPSWARWKDEGALARYNIVMSSYKRLV